jgi:hypothetical protein
LESKGFVALSVQDRQITVTLVGPALRFSRGALVLQILGKMILAPPAASAGSQHVVTRPVSTKTGEAARATNN